MSIIKKLNETTSKEHVELHVHTVFSAMDAVTRVNEVIKRAAEYGHPAVAITDYGNVQAFPEAFRAAKKYSVKVIYGIECDCINDTDSEGTQETYRVILLVKNSIGKKNLYKLISHYHNQKICITKSLLAKHREGLLVGTVGYKGELFKAIVSSGSLDAPNNRRLREIASFYDYIEILPALNSIDVSEYRLDHQTQAQYNNMMVHIAKTANKPFVAAGNVHFLDPEDEICKKVLLSAKGIDMADNIPLYFKQTDEMLKEFSYLGESDAWDAVVFNTQAIANCVDDNINLFFECAYFPSLDGSDENVRNKCISRAKEIYGAVLPETVRTQLNWELDAIEKHGFSVLYTIAQKLVERSKHNGYPVGTRGCIAASFVAFLLGITGINPLPPHYICPNCKHSIFSIDKKYDNGFDLPDEICPECGLQMKKDGFNLSVETILGLHGDMVPDIDLNFSGDYQALAVAHLEELFGKEHVFRAGTIQTLSERLALAYAKRYSEDYNLNLNEDVLVNIAEKIAGVKRDDGQHPGGYFVAPSNTDVTEFCPIYRDGEKYITHFSSFEISGYLEKIDLLGYDVPTLIRALQIATGIDPTTIPLDDKKTLQLLTNGDTIGIPEFRSPFTRNMIEKTKPSCLADLIKLSGLSHGTGTWKDNAEKLIENGNVALADVIALRDDVMQFLMKKGMNRANAHKYMKLIRTGRLCASRSNEDWESFFRSYNIEEWYIESVKKIRYLFPKAHAAAYTVQSFQLAWYKAYYPNEFFAVLFNKLDQNGIFTVSDFEKTPNDLCKELQALLEQASDNYYWSDDYHDKRICALELLTDAYDHEQSFVPLNEYESTTSDLSFQAGANNSIRTSFLNQID